MNDKTTRDNKKGYVYILSNSKLDGILKIGMTKEQPIKRAEALSKQTGAVGRFKVEWFKEVSDMALAERMLHTKLKTYSYEKEFFKLPTESAIKLSERLMKSMFGWDKFELRIRVRILKEKLMAYDPLQEKAPIKQIKKRPQKVIRITL